MWFNVSTNINIFNVLFLKKNITAYNPEVALKEIVTKKGFNFLQRCTTDRVYHDRQRTKENSIICLNYATLYFSLI